MAESESPQKLSPSAERMIREVGTRQDRIARARGRKNNIWSSFAVVGMIGWSVTVPTLLGIVAGVWIDRHWPSRFSWTLTLLIAGLVLGCVNAWLRMEALRIEGTRAGKDGQ